MNNFLPLTTALIARENYETLLKEIPFRAMSRTDFLYNTAYFAYGSMKPKTVKISFPRMGKYEKATR